MWLVAATVTAYSTAGAASAPNIPTDSWRLADKALRLLLLKLLVLLRWPEYTCQLVACQ